MAGWISSKLKVAETLLQQIDQQAAESLKKGERKPTEDELNLQIPVKPSGSVSLKDQLGGKSPVKSDDVVGKLHPDSNRNYNASAMVGSNRDRIRDKEVLKVETKPRASLTDSDWTELLSTPKKSSSSKSSVVSGGIQGLRRQGKVGSNSNSRRGNSGSLVSGTAGKAGNGVVEKTNGQVVGGKRSDGENLKNFDFAPRGSGREDFKSSDFTPKRSDGEDSKSSDFTPKRSDGEDSKSSDFTSIVSSVGADEKVVEGWELDETTLLVESLETEKEADREAKSSSDVMGTENRVRDEMKAPESSLESKSELLQVRGERKLDTVNAASHDTNKEDTVDRRMNRDHKVAGKASGDYNHSLEVLRHATYSESDAESGSDSNSGSSSGSDSEQDEEMRRRRQQILAAKAAAKAAEAIMDRENLVARLEGERESLEKILEERAKQALQEASELQSTMMETMEAVDLEKQKHNNTRMEALARLAKLETENAGLARSLANAEWRLREEVNRLAELREQIESTEATHEELRRRIASTQNTETSASNLVTSKGIQLEKGMLEAEYSFVTDKIARLKDKAKNLEELIVSTQKEMESPSEVEVEFKGRLGQMTDHLIQKQAQVEALSSERAMLLFRIEAVSKLLDENKSLMNTLDSSQADLESGAWAQSRSKLPPMFKDKLQTGKQHLNYFLRQLDGIYAAGAVFLSRNPTAKLWSLVYIICLHFWVMYIFLSYSRSPSETGSGAVVSIENLNNSVSI